jgi:inosose dehydratase
MAVRFGINPITWSNDDMPELGGDIPLSVCLDETREAGFAGTELGGKFPRQSAALRPLLEARGLALVSGWHDGQALLRTLDEEWEAALPHLTLLRDMGCAVVVYADTSRRNPGDIFRPLSTRPVLAESDWPAYGRRLTALAARMAAFGVRMAYHHHMGTIVQSEADIDRLMAHTGPEVGLLFDSGHCLFAGADPAAVLARHRARVVHVHCKDVRRAVLEQALAADLSFMDAILKGVFTVPGDGCIAFPALLAQLRGYDGWLVVEAEQDPRIADPLTYARMGHDNLQAMARAAGLAS